MEIGFDPNELDDKTTAPPRSDSRNGTSVTVPRQLVRLSTNDELERLQKKQRILELQREQNLIATGLGAAFVATDLGAAGSSSSQAERSISRPSKPVADAHTLQAMMQALPASYFQSSGLAMAERMSLILAQFPPVSATASLAPVSTATLLTQAQAAQESRLSGGSTQEQAEGTKQAENAEQLRAQRRATPCPG